MPQRLKQAFMVAMTARSEGGFIGFEVFLLSALLGLASGSWIVWLGTYLGLFMALGTTTGKILGTLLSLVWAVFVITLLDGVVSDEARIVFALVAFGISWYKHELAHARWSPFR
ncbi:hypothetical protein [Nitratidesulfovibrio vulgaris]|uniref:Uncharacterized protein n=1 Tax=Nitratidesulfovibrio vulgaris (strain DP4) TaxID=391774 RepID=A0A0H3A9Q3_NITV4|nr:hypothetical protein [Nitratidesulfovibrio vulgaris]ABM28902.1 conserved hypothetical protein [Nitratidesulfovibrio vulgaris DP4]GEB78924.1 hypothetical protein DDE01_03390 [Desulfovibrio desulfuricans]